MSYNHRMKPALLVLLIAIALGCGKEDASLTEDGGPGDTAQFVGSWTVVGDTAGQGHTGTLELNADGTFESIYNGSEATDTASGTFAVLEESGSKVVELTMTKYNGGPVPQTPPLRLFYDPSRDMLNDMLAVAYARSNP